MSYGLLATERPTLRDFAVRVEHDVLPFGGIVVRTRVRCTAKPDWRKVHQNCLP